MANPVVKCLVVVLMVNVCAAQESLRVDALVESAQAADVIVFQPIVVGDAVTIPGQAVISVPVPVPTSPIPIPVPGRKGAKPRMVPTLPQEYAALDKNGDGQIGMYEWSRTKYAEFVKLDKNGDGFLTPQELGAKGATIGGRSRGGVSEKDALPNPGNLSAYGQKVGESMAFSVTGRIGGPVYGTGTYTTDSDLATAVVHSGILKDGEKGVVTVTIVQSPNQFAGTTANGVTSSAWQSYPSAYTVR